MSLTALGICAKSSLRLPPNKALELRSSGAAAELGGLGRGDQPQRTRRTPGIRRRRTGRTQETLRLLPFRRTVLNSCFPFVLFVLLFRRILFFEQDFNSRQSRDLRPGLWTHVWLRPIGRAVDRRARKSSGLRDHGNPSAAQAQSLTRCPSTPQPLMHL